MIDLIKVKKNLFSLTMNRSFVVAYSGGLDSAVLLQLMSLIQQADSSVNVRAIHVNHQLQLDADLFQQHCEMVCASYGIPIAISVVKVEYVKGDSLEAKARECRYDCMLSQLQPNECLLTAHHLDDQAETILLQLMRGAGVKGLAAMPLVNTVNDIEVLRPMLSICHEDIVLYAKENNLCWIDDKTNNDTSFDRNYIRHKVMPILSARWPQAAVTLSRSARHCAVSNELIEAEALQLLSPLLVDGCQLSISGLLKLSPSWQNQVLRQWLLHMKAPLPDENQLVAMMSNVVLAKEDAMPCVQWKGYVVRRFAGSLYVMPCLSDHDNTLSYIWDMKSDLVLPSINIKLDHNCIIIKEIYRTCNDLDHYTGSVVIKFRRGGERMTLPGKSHSESLKNILQQRNIAPWQRDRVPLVFYQDKLIAVLDSLLKY